jgi:ABC-type branched-subunit amino acid transport system substrate-binding protein
MKLRAGLALLAVAGLAAIAVAIAAAATDSGRAPAAKAAAQAASCKKPAIGMSAPITGPAGSIGSDQLKWAQYYVQRWNALHPKFRVRLKQFDDQIDPAKAATGAQQFASDSSILAVIGPAGSQQVIAAAPIYKRAKLAIVSGSATAVSLTDGNLRGTFFRVVPNDGIQGPSDVNYTMAKLGVKSGDRVMLVDDSEAYGTGLRDIMKPAFEAKGVRVDTESIVKTDTDFTSIVNKTANDKVVFILGQIATQTQQFAQQMKEKGRTAIVFASDGSFDSSSFTVNGSYVSFFAPDVTTLASAKAIVSGYYAKFGKKTTPFGAPNYVVAQLEIAAIQRACKDGKVSRAEVARQIAKTNMKTSLLGVPIKFTANGDVSGAKFFIFKIVDGKYVVVG